MDTGEVFQTLEHKGNGPLIAYLAEAILRLHPRSVGYVSHGERIVLDDGVQGTMFLVETRSTTPMATNTLLRRLLEVRWRSMCGEAPLVGTVFC
jgi:hypothetical protein